MPYDSISYLVINSQLIGQLKTVSFNHFHCVMWCKVVRQFKDLVSSYIQWSHSAVNSSLLLWYWCDLFQEAFSIIDGSKDGIIDEFDLQEVFRSMGKNPSEVYLDEMLKQAPGCINFTMFLTLFGEKMMGCDPEDTILNAFACFDPNNTGKRLFYFITWIYLEGIE